MEQKDFQRSRDLDVALLVEINGIIELKKHFRVLFSRSNRDGYSNGCTH
jgi:hypothetical protein